MDITFYYGITTRKTQAGVTNVQRDDGPILDFSQARYHGKIMLRATSTVSAWARDMLHGSPTSCPCREWWWCRLLVEITREDLYASVCLSLYALALEVNLDDFELIYILTHLNDHIYRLRLIQKVLKSGLRTSLVRTTTQLYNDRYRCL
jgi:hypothetical protein